MSKRTKLNERMTVYVPFPPHPPCLPPCLFPPSLAKWVKRTEVLQQLAAFVWHYSLFRWNTEELWWILKWDSQNFPFEEKVFAQHGGSLCFLRFNLEESWHSYAWQYPYTLLFPLGLYSCSCLHSISSQLLMQRGLHPSAALSGTNFRLNISPVC